MKISLYKIIKRFIDLSVSLFLIIILSPFLLLISMLIYLEDKGKVIYKQERLGLNSKPFMIFKYRSMKTDAPILPAKDIDFVTYVTKIGKILRKTSLDELPQLINIIKGEMSFVGPRPLIPSEGLIINKRKEYGIDKLVPGLTGWAQIKDRQIEDHVQKIEYELYYLEHQSFLFDLEIMWKTLFNLKGR